MNREIPHSNEAEKGLLSCMLQSEDAQSNAIERIDGGEFYKMRHSLIFRAMRKVYERGDGIDTVTVADQLQSDGEFDAVGGNQYLQDLVNFAPPGANVDNYCNILIDKSLARGLIDAGNFIIDQAYETETGNVRTLLDQSEQRIFDISRKLSGADIRSSADLVMEVLGEIEQRANSNDRVTGVHTGIKTLDLLTSGLQKGTMNVIAARPSAGKSSLGLNMIEAAAVQHNVPCAMFSMEMSTIEIMKRLLSSMSEVPGIRLKTGDLHDDDYVALSNAAGILSESPIYIDDTAGLSPLQLRAKARRAHKRYDLGMIVVDYLQLMSDPTSRGNRTQEVSKISRSMKSLAKELDIPVVVLSQLSRRSEHREDHRPVLSDIRSCIPVDEWIYTPGGPTRLGDRPSEVISSSGTGIQKRPSKFVEKHYNSVYRVSTQFGDFRATARHPVLTGTGWRQVCDLEPGKDVIASPKRIPHADKGDQPHARLLGWLIGNEQPSETPGLVYRRELDPAVRRELGKFNIDVRPRTRQKSDNTFSVHLSNGREDSSPPGPIVSWLRDLGLADKPAHEKSIPEPYMGSSEKTHKELLMGLWETGGTVTDGTARFQTLNEALARQVSWLLLTCGIRSKVTWQDDDGRWVVRVSPRDNDNMKEIVNSQPEHRDRFGLLSVPDSDGTDPATPMLSTTPQSPYTALPEVGWGRIYSVEKAHAGQQVKIADLQVPGTNNFLVNGIVAHNSGAVEQDADMVMFIYRPELYYGEFHEGVDLRGKAELIVAKHRNGPTAKLDLTFQEQFTRFVDDEN